MPIYMQFPGIEGPVTAKGYKGWIELESCQLGTNRNVKNPTVSGGNREASVPSVSEVVVTKVQDSASGGLFRAALIGTGKKVNIDFVKGKEAPYLSLEMENTLISSYNVSGHGGSGNDRPMESLSLNSTKISYTTKATASSKDPKAVKDKAGWDLVAQ